MFHRTITMTNGEKIVLSVDGEKENIRTNETGLFQSILFLRLLLFFFQVQNQFPSQLIGG